MQRTFRFIVFFFFNDTATTEIYTLSLHDALPIYRVVDTAESGYRKIGGDRKMRREDVKNPIDRKSTRLNSSHLGISYAVFCLKKKKITHTSIDANQTLMCVNVYNVFRYEDVIEFD